MTSGGNDFNYFKLTKLANCEQFKRMLMFCLADWGCLGSLPPPLATPLILTKIKEILKQGRFFSYFGYELLNRAKVCENQQE